MSEVDVSPTAESLNTDPVKVPATQEQSIPYARFKEVLDAKKAADSEAAKLAKRLEALEQQKLQEKEDYKTLAQKAEERAVAKEAEAADASRRLLRLKIGVEEGIPAFLVERLVGDDEESVRADAKALLKALPKPTAPDTNAGQPLNPQDNVKLTMEEEQMLAIWQKKYPGLTREEYIKYKDQ